MHLAEARAIDVVATLQQQPRPDKMQLKAILNHVEKQKGFVQYLTEAVESFLADQSSPSLLPATCNSS